MDERDVAEELRDLNRRLSAIEVEGSPNMRERVARLETKVNHLNDPEEGVFPTLNDVTQRLRTWAIVLLSALVLNLILALVHILASGEFP